MRREPAAGGVVRVMYLRTLSPVVSVPGAQALTAPEG